MNKLSLAVCATAVAMIWAGAAAAQATTSAAPAGATSATAPATTAAAAPNDDEVVCETQAPPTGSLIGGVRVCRTRRQWHDAQAQTQVGQDLHSSAVSGLMPTGH